MTGLTKTEFLNQIRTINQRCQPPFDEQELVRIADSVWSHREHLLGSAQERLDQMWTKLDARDAAFVERVVESWSPSNEMIVALAARESHSVESFDRQMSFAEEVAAATVARMYSREASR